MFYSDEPASWPAMSPFVLCDPSRPFFLPTFHLQRLKGRLWIDCKDRPSASRRRSTFRRFTQHLLPSLCRTLSDHTPSTTSTNDYRRGKVGRTRRRQIGLEPETTVDIQCLSERSHYYEVRPIIPLIWVLMMSSAEDRRYTQSIQPEGLTSPDQEETRCITNGLAALQNIATVSQTDSMQGRSS
jgi:hypothetical protein